MTDAHIRPDEYKPQWKYRRIVIWVSIAWALLVCSHLAWSFSSEARAGTLDTDEAVSYTVLIGMFLGYLALVTTQYVWGAIQQLKDFFEMLAAVRN